LSKASIVVGGRIGMKRDGTTPVAPQNPKNPHNKRRATSQKAQKKTTMTTVNSFWAALNSKAKPQPKKSLTPKNNTITGSNRVPNSPQKQNLTAATMGQTQPTKTPKIIKNRPKSSFYRTTKLTWQILAISVGVSTILGTLISIANSYSVKLPDKQPIATAINSLDAKDRQKVENLFSIVSVGKELPDLRSQLEALASKYTKLKPGIFLVDLDSKSYVNIDGSTPYSSASTIKLPVLIAFFQDVDAGKIKLDEELAITKDVIGSGSGGLQYEKLGSKFSALEVAKLMITHSDNTATNMLVKRLGGQSAVNRRFMELGLASTRIQNPLPDLTGTNITSPEDLGNLLVKLDGGELVSLRSRDRILEIMQHVVTNTLLPQGLESGAIISHKTGDIKSVLGDAGIIDMPNGKRYIASVLVKRPDNDPLAKEFIQQMSKTAYQYFKWHK
jgi:beta-lactamase class A